MPAFTRRCFLCTLKSITLRAVRLPGAGPRPSRSVLGSFQTQHHCNDKNICDKCRCACAQVEINLRNALGVSFWGSPLVSQILFLGWDVDVMTVKEFLMQQLFLHE